MSRSTATFALSFLITALSASCFAACPLSGGRPASRPKSTHVAPIQKPVYRAVAQKTTRSLTPLERSRELVAAAKQSLKRGEYAVAKRQLDRVVKLTPDQADAYQFRSLVLFAQQDYDAAAADAYDTLLRGNMWTWNTVAKLYPSPKTYQTHYKSLARAARDDKQSMAKHFLLAYHHLMLGHLSHGEKELVHVLKIKPGESVTGKLLQVVRSMQSKQTMNVAATR